MKISRPFLSGIFIEVLPGSLIPTICQRTQRKKMILNQINLVNINHMWVRNYYGCVERDAGDIWFKVNIPSFNGSLGIALLLD
ncbi:hypothetical protein IHE45_05G067400 [Dioscorea alata]|uniref:Uncharacterized protein n=1 Tax=Dioscorea alata TaxID=55571 RepID=A0ACB7W2G7_DIOAL|nr:hypothetical protein IHE45_05G067400 [Dioscorea alata]